MRIELNAGGLGGSAFVSAMQSDINVLIGKSEIIISAFKSINNYIYNMNGGVGSLQEALGNIESRLQSAITENDNLKETRGKIDSFIGLTKETDLKVSTLVNQNKQEFCNMNSWAKPPQEGTGKNLLQNIADWLYGAYNSIVETAKKAWQGIKSFCSSVKEKFDELFAGFQEWWKDHTTITPTLIEDEVFDSENPGYYGGDQGMPENLVNTDEIITNKEYEYLDILERNIGKEFSEQELYDYVSSLNNNGCGYTALANTIMEYYCSRPNGEEEFYNKFHYNMRDSEGNLNYDSLIVDIYSSANGMNHDGSSPSSRINILTNFMNDSGYDGNSSVNVSVKKDVNITVNNYDNYVREGKQVVISGSNLKIYTDESKSRVWNCGGAGHAMIVTGVTEDGLLIVSTWGKKGYIDPDDNGKVNTHNYDPEYGDKIKMYFQTVEYE